MDTTESNTQIVEVPPDDGSITRAIADLDALISKWAHEFDRAQHVLRNLARHEAPGEAGREQASAPAPVAQQESAARQGQPQPQPAEQKTPPQPLQGRKVAGDEVAGKGGAPATGTGAAKKPKRKEKRAKDSTGAAAASAPKRILDRKKKSRRSPEDDANRREQAPPDKQDEAEPKPADSDDILLASLDPKVAQAIRIKRRLSNGKKSVRELLEEC